MDRGAWQATVHGVAGIWTCLSGYHSVEHLNCCCACLHQSGLTLRPHGLLSTRSLCPWDSPGKHTRVGSYSLLQRIFLIQGLRTWVSCIAGRFRIAQITV